jgi:hypothetical protein
VPRSRGQREPSSHPARTRIIIHCPRLGSRAVRSVLTSTRCNRRTPNSRRGQPFPDRSSPAAARRQPDFLRGGLRARARTLRRRYPLVPGGERWYGSRPRRRARIQAVGSGPSPPGQSRGEWWGCPGRRWPCEGVERAQDAAREGNGVGPSTLGRGLAARARLSVSTRHGGGEQAAVRN